MGGDGMQLTGNTVLITGGATGIGYAMAVEFLKAGSEVIICSRRDERLKAVKEIHPNLNIIRCDVSQADERERLAHWTLTHFPKLNVLVNNAGIQQYIDFRKGITDTQKGDLEIAINLVAPIQLTALLLPHLMTQDIGVVANVTSGLAFRPMPRAPVYCVTKAGLHTYSMLLRQQLAETTVKVFEIIPPMVDTELNMEGRAGLMDRGISVEAYIGTVMDGLARDVYELHYDGSGK
jgi:uncharacterized oxidoreductase